MRRLAGFGLALMLLVLLIMPADAATEASDIQYTATVFSDGDCQIALDITLWVDTSGQTIYFPIPKNASSVTVNGARVRPSLQGDVRRINLSKYVSSVPGEVRVSIQYSLRNVVGSGEGGLLQLQLPLLSGFEHSVKQMSFSVTLPGATGNLPGFYSEYYHNRIEQDIYYEVSGATISGQTIRSLKDSETLSMTLVVSEEMFPRSLVEMIDYGWATMAMMICGGCALLYWVLTMFNRPGFARTQPEMPQGYHAGNLGCALTGCGFDLSMAVLQWAQLGYLLIQVKGPTVFLHKQMDMGNERSDTEVYWFKKLFAKGNRVNTSEYRYAKMYLTAAKKSDRNAERMKRWNGNPLVLRILTAGVGLFAGVAIAVALAQGAVLKVFLILLIGALGAVSGWYMQVFGYGLLLRNKRQLQISLLHSSLWLFLGLISGSVSTGILMLVMVLGLSLLLAWGGRRTAMGRQVQMQTLGFARYMRKADKKQLARICRNDPDYFFRLAPGALALGREKVFAKKFGDVRLEGCLYLTSGMDSHMTALQWSAFMRNTVNKMNRRANGMAMEKLRRILSEIKRG